MKTVTGLLTITMTQPTPWVNWKQWAFQTPTSASSPTMQRVGTTVIARKLQKMRRLARE